MFTSYSGAAPHFIVLIPIYVLSKIRPKTSKDGSLQTKRPQPSEVCNSVHTYLSFNKFSSQDIDNKNNYKMSTDNIVAEAHMMCCASCGKSELDDVKLKNCDACDLVRYCSEKCQRDHRPKHEHTCKERAAELRDEILFRQPESNHMGECPICFLPLPFDHQKSMMNSCCSTTICKGCHYANQLRDREARLQNTCPFCRTILPTKKEAEMNIMKRVAANDRVAIHQEGVKHHKSGDFESAFEYYTKAAELGDAMAHYELSVLYQYGVHVDKDEKKEIYHLEEAAIRGHPDGRFRLGCFALHANKSYDRAVNHWIIAANLGHDDSIEALKKCYTHGVVSKEGFAAALRAHQAALDAAKSPQRDAADASDN